MTGDPDLTAELDAAEDIVMGRVEAVVTEWGVRRWAEGVYQSYGDGDGGEAVARSVAEDCAGAPGG